MENEFTELIEALRRPTPEILKIALSSRERMTISQQDILNYLAGFTHYREAASLLVLFGLKLLGPLPVLQDVLHQREYRKIVRVDESYHIACLYPESKAYLKLHQAFRNITRWTHQEGSYVLDDELKLGGRTQKEWDDFIFSLVPGLNERVTSVVRDEQQQSGNAHVYFISETHPGQIIDITRLFCHAAAIIYTPCSNPFFYLSPDRLREETASHSSLREARWFIAKNKNSVPVIELVNWLDIEYTVMPEMPVGYDYTEVIVDYLERDRI